MKKVFYYLFILIVGLLLMTGCGSSSQSNDSVTAQRETNTSNDNNTVPNEPTQIIDTTPPTITLIGEANMTLSQGDTYVELGATANDDMDGNLTIQIVISGEVDTSTVGNYTITYSVSDSAGNEANVSRGVEVKAATISVVPTPTPTPSPIPVVQKSTITGYAEDDPMPNATIKVTDENGNLIVETTSDANGKYTLEAPFEEGETYTLESTGTLGDRNITLHSIFKFSSDTVINANPLTELKYQLVQSGKSIEEAEALIRDYFMVVNGEKLERNRFDIEGSVALGMVDLAKLYEGTLPVDAIGKLKEDILRVDANESAEFSFRDMVRNSDIQLEASATSVQVGESVTVTLSGVDTLNSNYIFEWSGIPNDDNTSTLSKTFTMTEAGDRMIGVAISLQEENSTVLIDTQSIKINFYQLAETQNIELNGTDANISVSDDVKITIPANASGSASEIQYTEVVTNSSDYQKVFTLEPSGTTFATPLEIRIKYDPSQVYDPRTLVIKRISDDGTEEILKVKEIDYVNSELIFETEHFSKFIIEDDTDYYWEDTSFDVWNDITENTPFDFLKESMEYYCLTNNVLQVCQNHQYANYFNYELAKSNLEDTYKEIFSDNNYEVFINDYYIWKYIKLIEKGDFISNWNSNDYEGKAVVIGHDTFTNMVKYLFSGQLDGNRKYNIGYYLNSSYRNIMSYEFEAETEKIDKVTTL